MPPCYCKTFHIGHLAVVVLSWAVTVLPQDVSARRLFQADQAAAGNAATSTLPSVSGIYAGWSENHNFGDDLVEDILFKQFVASLQEAAPSGTRVTLQPELVPEASLPTTCRMGDKGSSATCDFVLLGGGSVTDWLYFRIFRDAVVQNNASMMVWGSGYQVTSRTKSPNTTEWQDYVCSTLRAARGAGGLYGGVRGTFTQGALRETCAVELPILRDSGLLAATVFQPGSAPASPAPDANGTVTVPQLLSAVGLDGRPKGWLDFLLRRRPQRPARGLVVLTFKANPAVSDFERSLTLDASSPLMQYKLLMLRALVARYHVALLPTDPGSSQLHAFLRQQLRAEMAAEAEAEAAQGGAQAGAARTEHAAARVHLLSHTTDVASLARLMRAAEWAYSERLHPGVMAAAAATPFQFFSTGIKYADYVSGHSHELGRLAGQVVLDPADHVAAHTPRQLAELLLGRLQHLQDNRAAISEVLQRDVADTGYAYDSSLATFVEAMVRRSTVRQAASAPAPPSGLAAVLACKEVAVVRSKAGWSGRTVMVACKQQ